jgi:glycosyltransferase involved in cell wall biosynthesis
MNFLYTLTAYPPYLGGAQLHQHLLAKQFQPQHFPQVISFWNRNRTDWLLGTTLNAHGIPDNYIIDDIPVHRLGFSWRDKFQMLPWLPLYYPLMSVALPPIARVIANRLQPFAETAALVHNVRIGREGITYASWQIARQYDIPFILTPVHHPRWVGWRYREYLKLYLQADTVIALTQAEKATLTTLGVHSEKIHVTGIGPVLAPQSDPDGFRKAHHLEGPFVLFLGQHYNYKGYRQVLEATRAVWAKQPDIHFVFMGPPVRQSEAVFKEFNDKRIHRLGTTSLEVKTNALAACDFLCVPSTQESFGGVYTEAWSFGKPVIGCNIPAVADVITDGVDGYLVEQQPENIAERIIDLLSHPSKAQAMGRAGKAKVEAHYTWPKLAEKTLRVYQTVCGSSA